MVDPLKNIGIVILAAGKGTRMNAPADQPKVLVPLLGRPLLAHLLENIKKSVVRTTPVIVIAPDLYIIRNHFGPMYEYAIQETQLGTGHALLAAKEKLLKYDHIIVLYGDHPFITAQTIDALVIHHLNSGADLTLNTLRLPHFEDWFSVFEHYGRIKRNQKGDIIAIIEKKDATAEELKLTEVNPGYYIFKSGWLWNVLPRLSRENASEEYYITDLVALALKENRQVCDVLLDNPEEALGVNTPEQLALAEKIMKTKTDDNARMYIGRLPL